jgi:hypothetical protein
MSNFLMTNPVLPFFPFTYPFNVRSNDWIGNRRDRLFFEKEIKLRKHLTLKTEDQYLARNLKKLGKWIEDMKRENPLYELEDAQLIIRPSDGLRVKHASIGAKIYMKKIDKNMSVSQTTIPRITTK